MAGGEPEQGLGRGQVGFMHQRLGPLLDSSARTVRFRCTEPTGTLAEVTARHAIGDLPRLDGHLVKRPMKRPILPETEQYPYSSGSKADPWVVQNMLNWPLRAVDVRREPIRGHVTRALTYRDFRLFLLLPSGGQYPEAYQLALDAFDEFMARLRRELPRLPDDTNEALVLSGRLAAALTALLGPQDALAGMMVLREQWPRNKPELVTLDLQKLALQAALKVVPVEQTSPEDLVAGPLVDEWRRIDSWLAQFLGETLPEEFLKRIARHAPSAGSRARSYRNHVLAWRKGLEVRGEQGRRESDRGLDVAPLPELPLRGEERKQYQAQLSSLVKRAKDVGEVVLEERDRELLRVILAIEIVGLSQQLGDFPTLKGCFVPPYLPNKFPNKWRKMEADAPARTLMAHLGKDCYSHIHYASDQARTITVREAARLQSFPDSFRFAGSMNPAFRQIGNAVPPLLAKAVAESIVAVLRATAS